MKNYQLFSAIYNFFPEKISELLKLGTTSYEELKEFSSAIEESLFKLTVPREKSQIGYKTDEVQMTAVDEFYVEQDKMGRVLRQIARVRVFVLSFLSGRTVLHIVLKPHLLSYFY